jgi:hypothetical protein
MKGDLACVRPGEYGLQGWRALAFQLSLHVTVEPNIDDWSVMSGRDDTVRWYCSVCFVAILGLQSGGGSHTHAVSATTLFVRHSAPVPGEHRAPYGVRHRARATDGNRPPVIHAREKRMELPTAIRHHSICSVSLIACPVPISTCRSARTLRF